MTNGHGWSLMALVVFWGPCIGSTEVELKADLYRRIWNSMLSAQVLLVMVSHFSTRGGWHWLFPTGVWSSWWGRRPQQACANGSRGDASLRSRLYFVGSAMMIERQVKNRYKEQPRNRLRRFTSLTWFISGTDSLTSQPEVKSDRALRFTFGNDDRGIPSCWQRPPRISFLRSSGGKARVRWTYSRRC